MDLRKVYNGTPVGTDSRCDTCANSLVMKGYSENHRLTMCDWLMRPTEVRFPVAECSGYADRRLPVMDELEKVAIPIESSRHVPRGFRPDAIRTSLLTQEKDED